MIFFWTDERAINIPENSKRPDQMPWFCRNLSERRDELFKRHVQPLETSGDGHELDCQKRIEGEDINSGLARRGKSFLGHVVKKIAIQVNQSNVSCIEYDRMKTVAVPIHHNVKKNFHICMNGSQIGKVQYHSRIKRRYWIKYNNCKILFYTSLLRQSDILLYQLCQNSSSTLWATKI